MKLTAAASGRVDGLELLVTVPEACRRLAVGRSTLYELLRRGVLQSVHIGSARRIVVADLAEFVRQLTEHAGDGEA